MRSAGSMFTTRFKFIQQKKQHPSERKTCLADKTNLSVKWMSLNFCPFTPHEYKKLIVIMMVFVPMLARYLHISVDNKHVGDVLEHACQCNVVWGCGVVSC